MILAMTACGSDSPPATATPTETVIPEETIPTAPLPEISTAPVKETDPPTETTASTASATETTIPSTGPPVTEPALQDSPAYQRILSIYNVEYLDPAALEAFARWIDRLPGFMEQYPEGWILCDLGKECELTCFSPRTDNSRRYGFWIQYSKEYGTLESRSEPYEIFAMDISREEVAQMVYSAQDPIGVPDDMKEGFLDFLFYHDMYPASLFWPDCETEWYFDWKTYTHEDDSQDEFITLFIKCRNSDAQIAEYNISSVFFNGTHIMEGWLDWPLIEETSTQPTVAP